tara:strand:- start:719 stop:1012 length:294 start_codon:yes stop_codon:yes gene_type:complete
LDQGIGTLGLSPDVFWLLTWADFVRLMESWTHNQNQSWDRTRYQSAMIANCAMGRKKTIKPKELFVLPHDNKSESKTPLPTEDEMNFLKGKRMKLPI